MVETIEETKEGTLPYIVKYVKAMELQDTMNKLTYQGYRIDSYEKECEAYNFEDIVYKVVGTTVKDKCEECEKREKSEKSKQED